MPDHLVENSSYMMTLCLQASALGPHYFDGYDDIVGTASITWLFPPVSSLLLYLTFKMLESQEYLDVLNTDIRSPIPEALASKIISLPPFIPIQGVSNFRDLSHDDNKLRPGYVYRSGNLSDVMESGKAIIATELGITTIFDLRNEGERQKAPPASIPGVDTVWMPYGAKPATLNLRDFAGEDKGASGFVKMYSGILEAAKPCFVEVFTHIRDSPDDPFIFHCSGKFSRIIFVVNEPAIPLSGEGELHV